MKRFIYILLSNLIACLCVAADISIPTNQFLKELFENPETRADFRDMWTGTPNASAERNDPNGGYMFRFQIQFEGSDDMLVFLSSDRFGDVRRSTPAWSIYQSTKQNSWRLVSVGEMFQSGGISVHHPSRTIIQVFPDRFDEGKTFVIMQISASGFMEKKRFRSEEINGEVKETIEKQAVPAVPKIEKIPLITYLRSPQTKWRPLSEHGMEAQSLDPGDAPLLASNSDVAWDEALKLLNSFSNQDSNPASIVPQKPEPESKANTPPLVHSPAPKKVPEAKPSTPVGESPSPTRWPVVAVVIVAALGLLWVLLKMRK